MKITIKKYQPSDKPDFVKLMEELQDFLAAIDPLHRMCRLPEYGELYTELTLKNIKAQSGVIYMARQGGKALGCISGTIENTSKEMSAGFSWVRTGRIIDLIVREDCRGKGIGTLLTQKLEDYFRSKSCDIIRVQVFMPNTAGHDFWSHQRYHDRVHDMVKQL
jgi:ribosomal protein S18 acetylase RimI-like enzyme